MLATNQYDTANWFIYTRGNYSYVGVICCQDHSSTIIERYVASYVCT